MTDDTARQEDRQVQAKHPDASRAHARTRAMGRAAARPDAGLPRLAYSPDEAAIVLGCSRDFFDEHVASELRMVRRGRRKFVPVRELERWLDEKAAFTLPSELRQR